MVTNQVAAELLKSDVFVVEINLDVVSASQQKHSKEKEVPVKRSLRGQAFVSLSDLKQLERLDSRVILSMEENRENREFVLSPYSSRPASAVVRNQVNSWSCPCDHTRKRPALVTTTFLKPRLNTYLNFIVKSSRKRPPRKRARPLLRLPNWTFPCF